MTVWMRLIGGSLLCCLIACAASNQPQTGIDGESHFLQRCGLIGCKDGLSCIGKVCTTVCEGEDACLVLSQGASCEPFEDGARCDFPCGEDSDCSELGVARRCEDGFCRPAPSDVPTYSGFLGFCEGDCDGELMCLGRHCTALCESDAACRSLSPAASCIGLAGTPEEDHLDDPRCDVPCAVTAECEELAGTYACADGYCRVAPPEATVDRAGGQPCRLPSECTSGVCEGAGCTDDTMGICAAAEGRVCTSDRFEYCGCDGTSFVESGSCPGRRFAHRGPC